jgi:hypothetical protein
MFKVYGLDKNAELKKWYNKNGRAKNENEEEYGKRAKLAIDNLRARPLDEFDILGPAQEFVKMAQKNGITDLSVKFEKLFETGKPEHPVSRMMVDVSELSNIDVTQQSQLRARLNGSAFA